VGRGGAGIAAGQCLPKVGEEVGVFWGGGGIEWGFEILVVWGRG
jgi:hypothetical protein